MNNPVKVGLFILVSELWPCSINRPENTGPQWDVDFVREPISEMENMRPRWMEPLGHLVAESGLICRQH